MFIGLHGLLKRKHGDSVDHWAINNLEAAKDKFQSTWPSNWYHTHWYLEYSDKDV